MRRLLAASLVLVFGFALVGCGPAPKREWPIWTNGGIYNNLDLYPSPGPN